MTDHYRNIEYPSLVMSAITGPKRVIKAEIIS